MGATPSSSFAAHAGSTASPSAATDAQPPDSSRGESAISLRSVRKTFGQLVAVDGVDLDVADGELFAMLGPSGSGKTTVLRMIAGFERPTSGTIHLAGRDATTTTPARRDVNTVFQDYALFPHLSVTDNVGYGLDVRGVAKAERTQRVGQALEMVRLADQGSRRPNQLSGGQRQRVALARALVGRPKVLLLDEPLGALDLKLREQMQVELKAIQRQVGITFVFVTHDQDEALTLCDRLAVFNAGRIEQLGSASEVYEHPVTAFVAAFVGTSNLVSGASAREIVGRDGTYAIRPEKVRVRSAADAADDAGADGGPRVRGVVREVIYAGATTRVLVDVAPGSPGQTVLSAVVLNVGAPQDHLVRGAGVVLSWSPEAVRELPT